MPGTFYPPTYFAPTYFGWLDSDAPPTTTTNAPNPNETVWSLGFGGATWDGTAIPGFALGLSTTLMNDGLVVAFPSGATLDASVWVGGDEAALFSPTIAWDTANGGYAAGVVALTMAAASLAPLASGDYRLQVGVTVSGVRSPCFDGIVNLRDTVGSDVAPTAWCSLQDMLDVSDQVASLNSRLSDSTGFLNIRARVTREMARELIDRFNPMTGDVRQRSAISDPIVGLDVSVATPSWLNQTTITAALLSPGPILETKLRDMVARRSVAFVLGRQIGNRAYAEEAAAQMAEAQAIHKCYRTQITVAGGPDNTPNVLLVFNGAIILPTGTSP